MYYSKGTVFIVGLIWLALAFFVFTHGSLHALFKWIGICMTIGGIFF